VVLVDVEVVEVVVDVVVDVAAAVVTGVVVDVVPDSVDVVAALSLTVDEEVAPDSVVAGSSSLQLAIVSARRMRGSRRIDFTGEVCHAVCRLPDQGVCLVATFNKL
jgi:hypothetical protein